MADQEWDEEALGAIAEEALENYRLARDEYENQQQREFEDLRFQVPEFQWSDAARADRQGGIISGVATPMRPCLSISITEQPIRLVLNQMQAAQMGILLHPVNEEANDETAEVMQGLYRTIERDSRADLARYWAFDRAVRAGRGFYRVNTVFDDQSEDASDQKIVIQRILYQDQVVFDPAAIEPDFSDARWAFISAWVPWAEFKRRYKDAKLANLTDGEVAECSRTTPNWVKWDGGKKAILVSEYFWKRPRKGVKKDKDGYEREEQGHDLWWFCLAPTGNGLEIMDKREWNGPDIPIIPVIGQELIPFDNERRWFGMTRPTRDAQQLYNFSASAMAERVALLPKSPWLIDPEQIEGYENVWAQANSRNLSTLPFRSKRDDGTDFPVPQRTDATDSGMVSLLQLLQQAREFVMAVTSTPDPALGNLNNRDRSGKAIKALQGQAEAAKSNYLQNFADISMRYEAKVVTGMFPKVYDRPGRIARILDIQGDVKTVALNAPFTFDQRGRPQVILPMPGQQMQAPPEAKVYDLTKGSYGIAVTVGKSFATRAEYGANELGAILQSDPSMLPLIGDIYFRFLDVPGHEQISKRLKKILDQKYPGIDGNEGDQETPEQLQGKLQAAEAQINELSQQLEMAGKDLMLDKAKQEAAIVKAQIDAQSKRELKLLDLQGQSQTNDTKVVTQKMGDDTAILIEEMRQRMQVLEAKLAQEESLRAEAREDQHRDEDAIRGMNGETTS